MPRLRPRPDHDRLHLIFVRADLSRIGRGCASALISAVAAAAAGKPRARLDVNTKNATGALGVYERLGFVATGGEIAFASRTAATTSTRP